MLIVIRDADFSANNIGTISVPADLNAFTKAALAASNNNGLASDKKQALDTFFKEMGAFGSQSNLWSKFDMVYLPFVVSGMEYSLMNYIDNTTVVTPNTSYFSKVNGGIKPIADFTSDAYKLKISSEYVFDYRNKSTLFLATENIITDIAHNYAGVICQYSGGGSFKRWGVNNSGASAPYDVIVPTAAIDNNFQALASEPSDLYSSGTNIDVRGISCNGTNVYFMSNNGIIKSSAVKSGADSYISTVAGPIYYNSELSSGAMSGHAKYKALGGLIIGNYLTGDEMQVVRISLMKLYNAFFE